MDHDEVSAWADLNADRVLEAVQADGQTGFCVKCGSEADGYVEPDAENYKCETCGESAVFGADQLLFYMTEGGGDE
jgi:hypothetical protein